MLSKHCITSKMFNTPITVLSSAIIGTLFFFFFFQTGSIVALSKLCNRSTQIFFFFFWVGLITAL